MRQPAGAICSYKPLGMSAQFVATALTHCLWNGKIQHLGHRKRPWLVLRRIELEQTYLRHQLNELRKSYPGKLEVDLQPVETDHFYDDWRLMVHCPELERVYELLYPRDTKTISDEVIDIVGQAGLVSLWCDRGRSDGKRLTFTLPRGMYASKPVARWLSLSGYGPAYRMQQRHHGTLRLDEEHSKKFARDFYPITHPTMRKGLLRGTR